MSPVPVLEHILDMNPYDIIPSSLQVLAPVPTKLSSVVSFPDGSSESYFYCPAAQNECSTVCEWEDDDGAADYKKRLSPNCGFCNSNRFFLHPQCCNFYARSYLEVDNCPATQDVVTTQSRQCPTSTQNVPDDKYSREWLDNVHVTYLHIHLNLVLNCSISSTWSVIKY